MLKAASSRQRDFVPRAIALGDFFIKDKVMIERDDFILNIKIHHYFLMVNTRRFVYSPGK